MMGAVLWVLWPLCNLGQASVLLWACLLCSSVKGHKIPAHWPHKATVNRK